MAEPFTVDSLSKSLQTQVNKLRKPIAALCDKFSVAREAVKEKAPIVMRLFNSIKAENEAFSFVEFCRMFDPSVPTHAADREGVTGYRNHKTYYTLDYMRRIVAQRPRGRQGVRDSATDALARSIATILQVVSDANAVWTAVQVEFDFNERIMGRLRKRVESTQPLIEIKAPAARIKVGNVIHMERQTTTQQVAA